VRCANDGSCCLGPEYVPYCFLSFFYWQLDFFFRFDDNDNTPCPTPPLWASAHRVAMGPVPGPRQVPHHTAPPSRLWATAHRGQWGCWWWTAPRQPSPVGYEWQRRDDANVGYNEWRGCTPKRQVVVWAPGMFLVFFLFFTYELDFFFRFDDNDTTPCPMLPLWASACRVAMGPAPGPRQVLCYTAPPPACEPLLIGGNGGAYDHECRKMRQQVLNLAKKICTQPGDKYDAPLLLQREMVRSFFLSFFLLFVCFLFCFFLSATSHRCEHGDVQ
jgi:hypothetical protein